MSTQTLFGWVHLSDLHFGHGGAGHQANQQLVLDALLADVAEQIKQGVPKPDALLVTGDIAFSGACAARDEYDRAAEWIGKVAAAVGVSLDAVYVVPGNHDVQRPVDTSPSARTWLRAIRKGEEKLDEILRHDDERAKLAKRQSNYLALAERFAPAGRRDPTTGEPRLYWRQVIDARGGLRVRLCGLNTALLAADEKVFGSDQGSLWLGEKQLAEVLLSPPVREPEVVVVLSHHPFSGGWLHDEKDVREWVRSRAHVHLSGHVHEAASERTRSGAGGDFIHVAAGASHGEAEPAGVAARHGYSFGELVAEGGGVALRIRPRRWSEPNKRFRRDIDTADESSGVAEHPIARVVLSVKPAAPTPTTSTPTPPVATSKRPPKTRPHAKTKPRSHASENATRDDATNADVSESALLDALKKLLDPQLEEVIFRLVGTERSFISAPSAPAATRVLELLRLVQQQADGRSRLVAAIRAVTGSSPPPPPPPPPPEEPRRPSRESVAECVRRAEAAVLALLGAHPRVLEHLTKLNLGGDAVLVTRSLLHERQAHEVARSLNHALSSLARDPLATTADHQALNRLFNECLRFAANWRALIDTCRTSLPADPKRDRASNTIELPLNSGALAELISAGIDDRMPAFTLAESAIVGVTHVRVPEILKVPLQITRASFVEAVVTHLAATPEIRSLLPVGHERSSLAEKIQNVDRALYAQGFELPPGDARPYYIALDGKETSLWQVAQEAQHDTPERPGLPSLRLIRLTGTDPAEISLVSFIKYHLEHTPRP